MYIYNNIKNEILQDESNGRVKPWRDKKKNNYKLAYSLNRLGYSKKANRVYWCSSQLAFSKNLENNRKYLKSAEFCKERLCPMCQWRKSIKVFYQTSKIMDKIQTDHTELIPIFLTLTLRNCNDADLTSILDVIFTGWKNIIDHYKIRKIVKGWFRALEVTYNYKKDTYHPHIHAIMLVNKDYFKSKDYMKSDEWVQKWRTACNLDYDPICDIRKVKDKLGEKKSILEVSKYTIKDSDIFQHNEKIMDKLIDVLSTSLKGRRLYAFGGLMNKVAKELKLQDADRGDLVKVGEDEEVLRADISTVLEVYRWNFGLSNYVKDTTSC